MYIDVVTKEIDEAKALIKNVQPTIRSFVTNKDFSLEERYRVWSEYAEKKIEPYLPGEEYGKISEFIKEGTSDGDFNKYETVDHEWLVDYVEENLEWWIEEEYELFFNSVDELKELLIETNFGSCCIYW